jgi:hypothetical protein
MEHKGRYSRGYLPHCDFPDSVQAITFRLADSVAKSLLDSWRRAASNGVVKEEARAELLRKIARDEDAGMATALSATP